MQQFPQTNDGMMPPQMVNPNIYLPQMNTNDLSLPPTAPGMPMIQDANLRKESKHFFII